MGSCGPFFILQKSCVSHGPKAFVTSQLSMPPAKSCHSEFKTDICLYRYPICTVYCNVFLFNVCFKWYKENMEPLATLQLIPLHHSRFARGLVTGWTSPDSLPQLWGVLGFSYVLFVLFLGILWNDWLRETTEEKGWGFFCFLSFIVDTLQRKTGKKGMKVAQDCCRSWTPNLLYNSSIPVLFCALQAVQVLICIGHLCKLDQQNFMFSVVHSIPDEHFRISSVILVIGITQCISK